MGLTLMLGHTPFSYGVLVCLYNGSGLRLPFALDILRCHALRRPRRPCRPRRGSRCSLEGEAEGEEQGQLSRQPQVMRELYTDPMMV